MDFYMKSSFHIMRDYLDDLVIYIVPYRRLYGTRILCVRGVIFVCALLCWYCMQFSRIYYVFGLTMFQRLYVFLSRVLFLCVTVYLSNSNTDSDFDSPSLERERERLKYM